MTSLTQDELLAFANKMCDVMKRSRQVRQVIGECFVLNELVISASVQSVIADIRQALLDDKEFKNAVLSELSKEVALNQVDCNPVKF